MGAIGFKLFLTTTLNRGHVNGLGDGEVLILPVTARDEEWSPTTQESMFNFVRLSDGGIERLDNVRPETVILCDLAKLLLPDSPIDFASFKEHREGPRGHREDRARAGAAGRYRRGEEASSTSSNRVMHTPEFGTPDGKAHFVVTPLPEAPAPLTLATVRSEGQFNTIIYEEQDSYRLKAGRDAIFLNREDMAAFGARATASASPSPPTPAG